MASSLSSVSPTISATDLGPHDPTVEHVDAVSHGNGQRYAYAGDDPISGHGPSGRVLGLTCGTAVVAGLAAITFTVLDVAEIVAAAAATAPTVGTSAIAGAGAAVG